MLGLVDYVIGTKKIDNMGRAGSVEVLALSVEMTVQPGIT